MGRKNKILIWGFLFIFLTCLAHAADDYLISIHLFRAALEGPTRLEQSEILSPSTCPELSSLMDKATVSEYELTAAVIEVLLDLYEIDEIEDLFLHEKPWNGMGSPLLDDLLIGSEYCYKIKLSPQKTASEEISLRTVINKTKKTAIGGSGETLIDQELVLTIDEPVIVYVPYQEQMYFMMLTVTTGIPVERQEEQSFRDEEKPVEIIGVPKIIHRTEPSYPLELWRRQIGGKIGVRVFIDEKGAVQRVDVIKSIHPYLNYTTVQAIRQWTFEPVYMEEKPVKAVFRCSYTFDPFSYWRETTWSETNTAPPHSPQEELLSRVLAGSGDYCRKLKGAFFDFICEEKIKETHYNLLKNIHWAHLTVSPRAVKAYDMEKSTFQPKKNPEDYLKYFNASESRSIWEEKGDQIIIDNQNRIIPEPIIKYKYQIIDPKKSQRNTFLCDYLIIKKDGDKEERRIILQENGRRTADRNEFLEEERFARLSPLFAPLRVLAPDKQSGYDFKLIETGKVHGKKAHVIEAVPKYGNEDGIWAARIWIDAENYQVLKCEIEGIPIDGYEEVLNDCTILNIEPIFLTTHEYSQEKNGILFPSRSSVRVAYPGIDYRGAVDKLRIDLSNDNYKFFTVETDQEVIKNIADDFMLFRSREKQKFNFTLFPSSSKQGILSPIFK